MGAGGHGLHGAGGVIDMARQYDHVGHDAGTIGLGLQGAGCMGLRGAGIMSTVVGHSDQGGQEVVTGAGNMISVAGQSAGTGVGVVHDGDSMCSMVGDWEANECDVDDTAGTGGVRVSAAAAGWAGGVQGTECVTTEVGECGPKAISTMRWESWKKEPDCEKLDRREEERSRRLEGRNKKIENLEAKKVEKIENL